MTIFEFGFALLLILIVCFLSRFLGASFGISWYFFILPLLIIAFLSLRCIGRYLSRRN
jgi:hypothetical protein